MGHCLEILFVFFQYMYKRRIKFLQRWSYNFLHHFTPFSLWCWAQREQESWHKALLKMHGNMSTYTAKPIYLQVIKKTPSCPVKNVYVWNGMLCCIYSNVLCFDASKVDSLRINLWSSLPSSHGVLQSILLWSKLQWTSLEASMGLNINLDPVGWCLGKIFNSWN